MPLKRFFFSKTRRAYLWLIAITGGFFLPRYFAHAFPGLDILTRPFIVLAEITTILLVAWPVSFGFLHLSQLILNWAATPALLGSIIHNQFVLDGWGIMRDFSNMFFILILVAIGIATALRIKQYEVKKLLPALLAVAILINFSTVICGLVIDASNIFMNFFLTAGGSGFNKSLTIAQSSGASLMRDIKHAAGHWSDIWSGVLFFKIIFSTVFNIIAGFALLLMGLLFIARTLVLWILVILSPLAFLSAVLPATKTIVFNKWKKEFLNWCFIGVTGAFFIYLAQLMMNLGTSNLLGVGKINTDTSEFGGATISALLMQSIPIIFLLIGYMVTLSTSGMGAKMITSVFQKSGKWAVSKKGRTRISEFAQEQARKIPIGAKTRKAMNKLSAYTPTWGQDTNKGTKVGRWVKRQAADVVGAGAKIAATPSQTIFGKRSEASKRVASEAYEKAKKQDMWSNATDLKNASTEEKVGIMRAMGELKQLKEAMKEKVVSPSDLKSAFKEAVITDDKKSTKELSLAVAHDENIMTDFGKIIEKARDSKKDGMVGGLSQRDRDQGFKTYQDKVLAGLKKEDDFEKLQMDDELKEKLGDIAINFYDARQLGQAGRTLGRSFIDSVQSKAEEKGASWFFEIDKNTGRTRNPHVPRYLASTAGAGLGYTPLYGAGNIKEMQGLQVESRNLENAIRVASSAQGAERGEKLNNLIKEIKEREESSANSDLKKILASARIATKSKLEQTAGTIKTDLGNITISEEAARDIREPGIEERGGVTRGKNKETSREPGPDER